MKQGRKLGFLAAHADQAEEARDVTLSSDLLLGEPQIDAIRLLANTILLTDAHRVRRRLCLRTGNRRDEWSPRAEMVRFSRRHVGATLLTIWYQERRSVGLARRGHAYEFLDGRRALLIDLDRS